MRYFTITVSKWRGAGKQAYQNPAEWHLVLTGAVEEEALLPLVEQLLASIPTRAEPAPRQPQAATPLPFAFPESPVREDVRRAADCPPSTVAGLSRAAPD